ncbi:hypothetical protein ACE6H2_014390 [Prunus campanulata]
MNLSVFCWSNPSLSFNYESEFFPFLIFLNSSSSAAKDQRHHPMTTDCSTFWCGCFS